MTSHTPTQVTSQIHTLTRFNMPEVMRLIFHSMMPFHLIGLFQVGVSPFSELHTSKKLDLERMQDPKGKFHTNPCRHVLT